MQYYHDILPMTRMYPNKGDPMILSISQRNNLQYITVFVTEDQKCILKSSKLSLIGHEH